MSHELGEDMKKRIKELIKGKQGMTLLEVLIVMSLIGILTLSIIRMLLSGQKLFVDHQSALSEKSMFLLIEETVKDEILFAKEIRIGNEADLPPKEGEIALYIRSEDGTHQLMRTTSDGKEQLLLGKDILRNSEMTLIFKLMDENKQVVQLEILGENYRIETAFKLNNLVKETIQNWEAQQGEVLIYKK